MKKNTISSLIAILIAALGLIGPATALAAGPAPVDLLSVATNNFAILSKTGVTNTGSHLSGITGNIGSSPITAAAMNNVFCTELAGTIYGVDAGYTGAGACFAGNPPSSNKTLVDNAILDVGTAYTNAAGRTLPDGVDLYGGNLGGRTFTPGLYKWNSDVTIPTNVTLSGGANDVWIFQITGNLSIASGGSVPVGIKVILSGGAQASNVFWQVGGGTGATLGTYSTFNGTILSVTQVIIQTGAVLNGRALAQTQVTLDAATITVPVPVVGGPVFIDTNLNGILDSGELYFNTISDAITAASAGNTIVVTEGTYTEGVNDTKGVILQASGAASIVGQVTLNALGSKIYGFNITNPSGHFGILINGFGNTEASNNTVHQVGIGATTGTNYGIFFQDKDLVDAANIKIQNNTISSIGTVTNGSNGGIGVGDSTGNSNITGVIINGNIISGITANTTAVSPGKGAYGIIINHAIHNLVSNMGSTPGAQVTGNTISTLNGRWAHGIGLEGNTPNAVVIGNSMSNFTASTLDASAIHFDDNVSSASVQIKKNSFDTASIVFGVVSTVATDVDATLNYWNTSTTDPSSKVATTSTGTISTSPWYTDAAMTNLKTQTITSGGTVSATVASTIATTTITSAGAVSEFIPAGTTIIGAAGWDGTLSLPAESTVFTLTPDAGYAAVAISAIEVGAGDLPITFNTPTKLTFAGLAGKLAGWSQAGVFHKTTTTCDSATAPTLAPGADCKIDVGSDLVIWTKHFTTFIVYTESPVSATLHVIKLVVNSNGGASIPSDFNVTIKLAGVNVVGSPAAGAANPGTLYSLSAGTYVISENTNTSYTQSFSGSCDAGGSVTLAPGDDKICTIIDTDIAIPVISSSATGNNSTNYFAPLPLISITKIPSPLALPSGPGLVTYTYSVTNLGIVPMIGVWVKDNQCAPVNFVSGDTNNNARLDTNEAWVYTCTQLVSSTITNIVTAHGNAGGADGYDTAFATVVVGRPGFPDTGSSNTALPAPIIKIVTLPNRLTAFPIGGGDIIYTYTVTNPGVVAMSNVAVNDNKCIAISGPSGDVNGDKLLNTNEAWVYTCKTNISASTADIATVVGKGNGFIVVDYTFINIPVIGGAPAFPNTGSDFGQQVRAIATSLVQGSRGNNVSVLQQYLISQNKGSAARALASVGATGYFGVLTRASLAEFQAGAGISPPLGNFGPITRNYLRTHPQ